MTGPIVVTGASGFVGRRLVARLLADGLPVRALVRKELEALPGLEVIRWEIGEPIPLDGARAVVHAAAFRPPRYSDPTQARACVEANALGTHAVVEAAADAGIRRFVYVSTGHVYKPTGRPSVEDDAIWPSMRAPYYLGSKIAGEFFVEAASDAGRVDACTLRLSAVYGPGMPAGLVPTFLAGLRSGKGITVADGGRYRADLVHVDDVARAIVAAALSDAKGPINVGSGTTLSTLEVARTACEVLGVDPGLVDVLPPSGTPPEVVALDIERARTLLGFAPRSFAAGLRQTVEAG